MEVAQAVSADRPSAEVETKRTGHGFSGIDTDLFFVFKFVIHKNPRESVAAFCSTSKIKNCFGSAWAPVNLTVFKCAEYRDQQGFSRN